MIAAAVTLIHKNIKTGAVDKYFNKFFIKKNGKIKINTYYRGETVISSSLANNSPLTNSCHASNGQMNPVVILFNA